MRLSLGTCGLGLATWGLIIVMSTTGAAQYSKKTLVAHRGASAYAPEHTAAAYKLAIEMGADYVEQDLAVTKDGVLICLHDASLERTTDVEQKFPNRSTSISLDGKNRQAWVANDFTLAEIKTLDAGSWFDKKFAELVAAALDKHGLRGAKADPKTPVILQTFGQSSARKLAAIKIGVPVVLLIGDDAGFKTAADIKAWKGIVQGFGPAKNIVSNNPDFVKWAHAEGMTVTPYTISSKSPASGFPGVAEEMAHYLYKLDVDALFTDNPDKFPRK